MNINKSSATLGERIDLENFHSVKMLSSGNRQLTFSTQKVIFLLL
jgi:hypothetical protein